MDDPIEWIQRRNSFCCTVRKTRIPVCMGAVFCGYEKMESGDHNDEKHTNVNTR